MPHESCEPYFVPVVPLGAPAETGWPYKIQRRALDLCACGHAHTAVAGFARPVCLDSDCACEGFTHHPQPKEVSPGAVVPRRGDAAREAARMNCGAPGFPHIWAHRSNEAFRSCRWCGVREPVTWRSTLVQAGGLGRCIFQPSCEAPRALGSQFCLDHDPTRSAPAPILDEPATAPVATPGDAQLLADHYFSGAGMRARLFMLPSGRWHADVTGPGGHFCAISTPDVNKAVYFVVRRLRGAL